MDNKIYPAIFHKDEGGKYWVEFPDLPGCLSEGDSIEEAFRMAGDALYVWLADGDSVQNKPSALEDIKAEDGALVQLVSPAPYTSEDVKKYLIEESIEKGLKKRNLNRNQVATILGVDRSYMTYITNGRKKPSPDMAKRIALLLDFDWRIFYEDERGAV